MSKVALTLVLELHEVFVVCKALAEFMDRVKSGDVSPSAEAILRIADGVGRQIERQLDSIQRQLDKL